MSNARFLPLALTALLSGCISLAPSYERPALDLPEAWPAPPPDALPADAVPARWWTIYNDPVLERLIDEAYAHNLDLMLAAARVDEARAQLGLARADQAPRLSAEAERSRNRISQADNPVPGTPTTFDRYRADLVLTYEVDFWGRFYNASKAARAELLATEAARDTVKSALAANVANGYFALVALDAQADATRRVVERGTELLKLQRLRYESGVISEFEFQQRAAEVEATSAQLPALEGQRMRQERALALLLGRSPRAVLEGTIQRDDSADVAPVVPAGLPSVLLLGRPDLREAEQRLIAATANIGVARTAFFPSISLTGTTGSASTALTDLFSGPARTWSFAGLLAQPIFGGGRAVSLTRTAEARRAQALAQYQSAIANAFAEVQNAADAQTYARAVLDAEARREKALRRAYELAELRYRNGVASQLDVIDSERQLLQAVLNRHEAQRTLRAAIADLYRAIGAGATGIDNTKNEKPQEN